MSEVIAVSCDQAHRSSKNPCQRITLVQGFGVEGDAHFGETVEHRSRVAADPTQPNLRQVHLIHDEILQEFNSGGFEIRPGDLGENITTRGIDVLGLAEDTVLHIGDEAVLLVTGLRNPCMQLDSFAPGLMQALLGRDSEGNLVRKAGVMCVVARGGIVKPGDVIVAKSSMCSDSPTPRPLSPI